MGLACFVFGVLKADGNELYGSTILQGAVVLSPPSLSFVCSQTLCGIEGVGTNISKDHSAFCLQDQAEFFGLFHLEDEGTMNICNVRSYLHSDTVLHPEVLLDTTP